MAEVLGIGMHHTPHYRYPVAPLGGFLKRLLARPGVPAEMRAPGNWPAGMRAELGDDGGLSVAVEMRRIHEAALRRLRVELDDFAPDLLVIFGDDQRENFQEEIIPPFCLHVYDSVDTLPFHDEPASMGQPNVWGRPPDEVVTHRGHKAAGLHLGRELIARGFDMPYALRPRDKHGLAHAHLNTVTFLDYDQQGFSYPIVPISVNCLGSDVFETLGVRPVGAEADAPPPGPSPRRCFALGQAVRAICEASPWRVAIIGSSAWSHCFLTRKTHGLWADLEADAARFAELQAGRQAAWADLSTEEVVAAGQHEMLNWICLAGAMADRRPEILAWTQVYVGAGHCVALFRPDGQA
jgi:hypothetical protein